MSTQAIQPRLEAPGAGLPRTELFFARIGFRFLRATKGRRYWDDLFDAQRAQIVRLVEATSETDASRQVLVKRLRGLEDSSRFWSVYMVLNHLNIVNHGVTMAIVGMSRGVSPAQSADTATVKPNSASNSGVLAEFEECCDQFKKLVGAIDDLKTKARYAHPWFGPMDAAGWHALVAFHMRLHRKQIEAIRARLG